MSFPFENLLVYQQSLSLVCSIEELIRRLKSKVSFSVRDQLSRAAMSISLNISEGQGRWHRKEKREFYWIARGSAFEVVAILQILNRQGLLQVETYNEFYSRLEGIAKMLTGLIKSVEELIVTR